MAVSVEQAFSINSQAVVRDYYVQPRIGIAQHVTRMHFHGEIWH
jgi:hypothetical protein